MRRLVSPLDGIRSPFGGRFGFSPASLFASGEQGVWYDPSDMTTLFQDSAGTTPVTAVEQPVGLMLDKSKGLVLGPELVTNGDFATDTAWTKGTGWVIGSGVASKTTADNTSITQTIPTNIGTSYRVVFSVTTAGISAGVRVFAGDLVSSFFNVVGTYSVIFKATSTTTSVAFNGGSFSGGSIDNISVKELPGNHATQSTSASRPVLSAKVNLLLNSLLNGGVSGSPGTPPTSWTYSTTGAPTVTFAPDTEALSGNTVRVTLGTLERQSILQSISVAANTTYIFSVVVDVVVTSAVWQFVSWFSPPTGATLTWQVDGVTVSGGSSAPLGRHVLSTTLTVGATAGTPTARFGAGLQGATTGPDVIFRQPQLQTGSTRSQYQWTNTATDYDTTGFPMYLKFDGTDDGMATATINPGSVDKAQVFAGARKLSDAAQQIVAEHGPTATNGTFTLSAPPFASAGFSFWSRGTLLSSNAFTSAPLSPVTQVVSGLGEISTDTAILRLNGVQAAISAQDQGTGNYLSYPLYIGRRGGSTLPFNGHLYSLVVRFSATNLPDATIAQTETWVAGKTGIPIVASSGLIWDATADTYISNPYIGYGV